MSEPRKFDEALRDSLRPEGAPAELRNRLLAEARRQDAGRRFTLRPYLAAAALLLTLGSGIYLGRGLRPGPPVAASALPALLEATSKNYRTIQGLDFTGRECTDKACGIWALHRVGFTAPLPACMEGAPMVGGRSCAVQGRPVAHYAFRDGRAVYVFAGPLEGCGATPGNPRPVEGPFLARAWNEGGRGYVLLEPGR
jgi:anti-sigma factor RsiW